MDGTAIAAVCGALVTCTGLVIGYLKSRDSRFRRDAKDRIESLERSEKECRDTCVQQDSRINMLEGDVTRLEREIRELEHTNRNLQATVIDKQNTIDRIRADGDDTPPGPPRDRRPRR